MNCTIKLIIFLIILTSFPNLSLVYGKDGDNLPSVSVQPGMFYYPIKRLFEKVTEKFQFTNEAKEEYYRNLIQIRLAELYYIADKDYIDQLEKSTQRVSYQVGIFTDYVIGQKLNYKKQNLVDLYKEDKVILEKLRDKYPANSSYWMLVQHVINSIDINLQKL